MTAKLIAFECVARDHQPSATRPDKLTIHAGSWAFCAFDAHADGHEWRETGGIDVDSITRRSGLSVMPLDERHTVKS